MQKIPVVFIVIGATVGIVALVVGFAVFPMILKKKISEQSRLVNGTDKWETWREVPIEVFQKIYIFNVTNPDDVRVGGKPNLVQLGPYVYQQKRTKVGIHIDLDKDTISYRNQDFYFFRGDLSTGQLSDQITVLNMPYLGAAYKSILAGTSARYLVNEILTNDFPDEDIYVHITVDEFLFGGYYVPFMKDLSDLKGEQLLPNNTFGLYYGRNGSESLQYEIMAGVKEPEKFANVIAYDNKTSLELYEGEQCEKYNAIQGYDGASMPPFVTKDREFYLFVPTLCKSMKFTFDSEEDMMGVPGYRFTVPKFYLADVKTNPENECFCSNTKNDFEKCLKGGAWELGRCKQGTPLVMSFPHFYDGAEEYLSQSTGLNPVKEDHQMTIVLQPMAAIAMQVAIRVQMNFALTPSRYFKPLKKIAPDGIIHPLFWMDQGVTLPEDKIQMIKDKLIKTQEVVKTGSFVGLGVGIVFIVIAVLILVCKSNSAKNKNQYEPDNKAPLQKLDSYETDGETSPTKADWSQLTPNEKYSKIASPPNARTPEEIPLVQQSNGTRSFAKPVSIPIVPPTPNVSYASHSPATRTNSNPIVVGVVPKVEDDEVNQNNPVPAARMHSLGAPFPKQNDFSSSTSVNNDLNEIDDTLKGINDALSSYENLK